MKAQYEGLYRDFQEWLRQFDVRKKKEKTWKLRQKSIEEIEFLSRIKMIEKNI